MPRLGKIKRDRLESMKIKAKELYKKGYTTREVGILLGKSRTWVSTSVKDHTVDNLPKT